MGKGTAWSPVITHEAQSTESYVLFLEGEGSLVHTFVNPWLQGLCAGSSQLLCTDVSYVISAPLWDLKSCLLAALFAVAVDNSLQVKQDVSNCCNTKGGQMVN